MKTKFIVYGIIVTLLCCGCGLLKKEAFVLEQVLKSRPSQKELLFDYADVLEDAQEYSNRYLKSIRDNCRIEALIVSVPSLNKTRIVEELAVELFHNWEIGKKHDGRGILLLLVDDVKQIKLEISSELEDVFTDAFSGYVEDIQLRPYFLGGQLGIGLIAVMEEMEKRAQIKHRSGYSADSIAKLDMEFLSQGAGAKRDLLKFEREEVSKVGAQYPAGKTANEAWQTMIQSWRDKVRDPNLGVYTEMTRLSYRDYQNFPDSHYEKEVRTYADKSYKVIQDNKYAVIFFGNKKGWDNSPFLLCKTPSGWKFDIVHQRKYLRMGLAPHWGIERASYPYIDFLSKCPYFMGQDIPLESEDVYHIRDDEYLANRIIALEKKYKHNPYDFQTLIELGMISMITSHGRLRIQILNKAKQLRPDDPRAYKYLAISHVDMFYQYKKAIEEIKEYIRLRPKNVFGHNFIGYLYFQDKQYEKALDALKVAVQLRLDNCYAYCKLSRAYAMLFEETSQVDPRRIVCKSQSLDMLEKAQSAPTPDDLRIQWLKNWLRKKGML